MSGTAPETTWHAHYRARLGDDGAFDDRLLDPAGLRPPIWFQQVPESKAGKNRLHPDLYPTLAATWIKITQGSTCLPPTGNHRPDTGPAALTTED